MWKMLNSNPIDDADERKKLERKYASARTSLLLVIVFTILNILLLLIQSDIYFLFSAYIPYILTGLGMVYCGLYPSEYYSTQNLDLHIFDSYVFSFFIAIAVGIILLYNLCWFFTKKSKVSWLIFALVLFGFDTIVFLCIRGIVLEAVVDYIFHIWVLASIGRGIYAHYMLKNMPECSTGVNDNHMDHEGSITSSAIPQVRILRMMDSEVKARVLLEAEVAGHKIIYRRVKRVNELIVDGRVYDEYVALIEFPHSLKAFVANHVIEAGMDTASNSYINVDGQMIARKMRLV